jgi:hypothetical protein
MELLISGDNLIKLLNDEQKLTFPQIADLIEEYL